MQVIWHAADIRAGRRVGKLGRREQWMIGYAAELSSITQRWTLISTTDGMVSPFMNAAALAALLNTSGDLPVELLP